LFQPSAFERSIGPVAAFPSMAARHAYAVVGFDVPSTVSKRDQRVCPAAVGEGLDRDG
jgi:hypothetical protein